MHFQTFLIVDALQHNTALVLSLGGRHLEGCRSGCSATSCCMHAVLLLLQVTPQALFPRTLLPDSVIYYLSCIHKSSPTHGMCYLHAWCAGGCVWSRGHCDTTVTHKVRLRRAQATIASCMHMQKKRVEFSSPLNHMMIF